MHKPLRKRSLYVFLSFGIIYLELGWVLFFVWDLLLLFFLNTRIRARALHMFCLSSSATARQLETLLESIWCPLTSNLIPVWVFVQIYLKGNPKWSYPGACTMNAFGGRGGLLSTTQYRFNCQTSVCARQTSVPVVPQDHLSGRLCSRASSLRIPSLIAARWAAFPHSSARTEFLPVLQFLTYAEGNCAYRSVSKGTHASPSQSNEEFKIKSQRFKDFPKPSKVIKATTHRFTTLKLNKCLPNSNR